MLSFCKRTFLLIAFVLIQLPCFCWGFFAHQKINYYAVFLLPPQMLVFYKPHIQYLSEHAVDPDKRRYLVAAEGPRHYIDIDYFGHYPYDSLPRYWKDAVAKFSEDTLQQQGILPWWLQQMQWKLTEAFKEKDAAKILKLSADIGHYMADAHVPLHVCSNHNGQLTGQQGIHAFWESRVPELLADKEWNFFMDKAVYIPNTSLFIWQRILESAAAADTVLQYEKQLSERFPANQKYAFENRNNIIVRQYSTAYTKVYNQLLKGMVERRMRQSIYAVASLWYTAWVDAGQPDLSQLTLKPVAEAEQKELEQLNQAWRNNAIKGREHHP